ncbi:MAG TPA: lipopolysaccharide biosynthesis protein [Kofleriaceae bacterium]|nr:lipopolysaccharide biosynthesis protein [Kofleriaceae bacterium]
MADEPAPKRKKKGDGLGKRTTHAMTWTAAGAIVSNALRLVMLAVLGRLLAPEDFGVVAAAMTVILFVGLLRDFGLGLALVQRPELEREHVEVAFTITALQGVILTGLVALAAGPIADFFEMPHATSLVRALSLLFLLRSLSIVPNFMLQREMQFRALTIIDVVGYIAGSITSVTLAYLGNGPWALVWGYCVETLVNTAQLFAAYRTPIGLKFHRRHFRELLGFGIGKTVSQVGNYFATQGDYMVIGRMLPKTDLGLYQRAYELVRFPATVFTTVAGKVLFSAFSKVQDDPERMGRVLRRSTFGSAIVLMPASAGLIVLAPEVIHLLLGGKWSGAIWPFRIMAASMMFRTTYKLGAMVGRSAGEVMTIAKWQWFYAAAVVGGAAVSVYWGILGVACTTSLAITLQFCSMYRIGLKMTNLRARDIVAAFVSPVVFSLAVGGVTWVTAEVLRNAGASYLIVAAVATVTGSATFLVLVLGGIRRGHGDWGWLKETLLDVVGKRRKKQRKQKLDAAANESL